MVCPQCGSNEVSDDGNESACSSCGYVFEDGNIVAEVGFVELGDGTSTVSGQYVSEKGTARFGSRIPGFSRQSREVTIDKARRRIQAVASQLSLGTQVVEAAHRFYKLALQHNFVQGRRTHHVVAACLYMACRIAQTPHMLIDFADVLQTNVYVLGRTFLQFCHLLNTNLPLVDPSLYIQRFAARLEFEDKTQTVANTALRIVQRMKRDWIQTGRRPAGVCGASLFIAAKLHGFRRTPKEIIQVVRVCDVTLRKRLYEFEETASSMLTAEEFDTIDLDQEQDPPAYTKSILKEDKIKNKKKRKLEEEEETNIIGEELDVDDDLLEKEIQATLQSKEFRKIQEEEEEHQQQQQQSQISQIPIGSMPTPPTLLAVDTITTSTTSSPVEKQPQHTEEDTLSDIEDAEIDSYIMSSKEVEWKTELWTEMNKDFLKKLEQKEKLRAEQEQKPKKPRKKREIKRIGPADSPAEAAAEMLKKKVSSKLNYSALEELFKEDNLNDSKGDNRIHKFSAYEPTLEEEIGTSYSNKMYDDYENYEE